MFEHSELIEFATIRRDETLRTVIFDRTVFFRVLENDRIFDHSTRELVYSMLVVIQSVFRGLETRRIYEHSTRRNGSDLDFRLHGLFRALENDRIYDHSRRRNPSKCFLQLLDVLSSARSGSEFRPLRIRKKDFI